MNVMNGRKIACDRIENVCFDVGLIAKGNSVLLTGSSFKRLEILSADKHLEFKCDIDLH